VGFMKIDTVPYLGAYMNFYPVWLKFG